MLRKAAVTSGLVTLAVLASGTSAYAYWSVYGQGSSTATVAQMKPLDIVGVPVQDMVIGVPEDLTGNIRNPNRFEASLTGLKFTIKVSVDSRHSGCGVENFRVSKPAKPKFTMIPPRGSIPFVGGTIELIETGKNQVACQGAVVTLDYLLR